MSRLRFALVMACLHAAMLLLNPCIYLCRNRRGFRRSGDHLTFYRKGRSVVLEVPSRQVRDE